MRCLSRSSRLEQQDLHKTMNEVPAEDLTETAEEDVKDAKKEETTPEAPINPDDVNLWSKATGAQMMFEAEGSVFGFMLWNKTCIVLFSWDNITQGTHVALSLAACSLNALIVMLTPESDLGGNVEALRTLQLGGGGIQKTITLLNNVETNLL